MGFLDQYELKLSPEEFEVEVERMLQRDGVSISDFAVQRLEDIDAADGTYQIDITARFRAVNVDFLILIECKRHTDSIKRETVQILRDKVASIGAHKGILFSTSGFQQGAVSYAKAHGIALVRVADGRCAYLTRSMNAADEDVPAGWPSVVGWVTSLSEAGNVTMSLLDSSIEALMPALLTQ